MGFDKPVVTLKATGGAKNGGGKLAMSTPGLEVKSVHKVPNTDGHKVKVIATDATLKSVADLKLNGASVTYEIPSKFSLCYTPSSKAFSYDVSSKTTLADKPLTLKLSHNQKGPATTLEATCDTTDAGKLNAKLNLNTNGVALKYTHTMDSITYEPTYDMTSKAWSISAKKKNVFEKDDLKVAYNSKKVCSLEYNKKPFKLTLSAPVSDMKSISCGISCEQDV